MNIVWLIVIYIILGIFPGENRADDNAARKQRADRCRANNMFEYIEFNKTRLCLYWSIKYMTYQDAKMDCKKRDSHMMTVRNWNRLRVLRHQPNSRWVGLDDMESEDYFRWQDNNNVIDLDYREQFFFHVDPATGKDKDCIYFMRFNLLLDDISCSAKLLYVCETNKF